MGELCILEGGVLGADFVLAIERRYAINDSADRDSAAHHRISKTDGDPYASGRRGARVCGGQFGGSAGFRERDIESADRLARGGTCAETDVRPQLADQRAGRSTVTCRASGVCAERDRGQYEPSKPRHPKSRF